MPRLDYANERYVRSWTRDTDDWLALAWQGRALWPLIQRKLDRAGVLETRRGARGVAALVNLPVEVVEVGLKDLLEFGWLVECTDPPGYLDPDFIEAQEAVQSDALRSRNSRNRRASIARGLATSEDSTHDDKSQDVTGASRDPDARDNSPRNVASPSRNVTRRHEVAEARDEMSLQPSQAKPAVLSKPAAAAATRASAADNNPADDNPLAVARELVTAANQVLLSRFGDSCSLLRAEDGAALSLARHVLSEGIPLRIATESIRQKAAKVSKPIRSLKYFEEAIVEAWAAERERIEASRSRPPSANGRPTPLQTILSNAPANGAHNDLPGPALGIPAANTRTAWTGPDLAELRTWAEDPAIERAVKHRLTLLLPPRAADQQSATMREAFEVEALRAEYRARHAVANAWADFPATETETLDREHASQL